MTDRARTGAAPRRAKRRLLLAASLLWLPAAVCAQPAEVAPTRIYAVLSLIGDSMSVVVFQPHVGSLLDTNRLESVPLSDDVLDVAAVSAAKSAVLRVEPHAAVVLLKATSPAIYAQQGSMVDGPGLVVPKDVASALQAAHATHLLVFSKHRGVANLRAQHSDVGAGKIQGVGYYVDNDARMRRFDTGERGVGFLAPFVFIKASLFDAATLRPVGSQVIEASTTLSAARNTTGIDAWGVLTPTEKLDRLRAMVAHEVRRVVPQLLAAQTGAPP